MTGWFSFFSKDRCGRVVFSILALVGEEDFSGPALPSSSLFHAHHRHLECQLLRQYATLCGAGRLREKY